MPKACQKPRPLRVAGEVLEKKKTTLWCKREQSETYKEKKGRSGPKKRSEGFQKKKSRNQKKKKKSTYPGNDKRQIPVSRSREKEGGGKGNGEEDGQIKPNNACWEMVLGQRVGEGKGAAGEVV